MTDPVPAPSAKVNRYPAEIVDAIAAAMTGWSLDNCGWEEAEAWRTNACDALDILCDNPQWRERLFGDRETAHLKDEIRASRVVFVDGFVSKRIDRKGNGWTEVEYETWEAEAIRLWNERHPAMLAFAFYPSPSVDDETPKETL